MDYDTYNIAVFQKEKNRRRITYWETSYAGISLAGCDWYYCISRNFNFLFLYWIKYSLVCWSSMVDFYINRILL